MQASPHYLVLRNLDAIIDSSPLTVGPETLVLDAIALMAERCQDVLVKSGSQVIGCLTSQDIMRLVALGTELRTTKIAEVMQSSVIKLKVAAGDALKPIVSLFSQTQTQLIAVIDEQDQMVGVITPESICLALGVVEMVENQLLQSQQMLQLIMDTIPHGIFWKDIHSVFLGCNRNFAKMVGFENPEDIVGKTDFDLVVDPEQAEFYDATLMEANQPEYYQIIPKQQADGSQIWLETNKVPLHSIGGQVVGMLGTVQDVTQRKETQEALEKSEEWFRFLAESIPQQVWIADADGNLVYMNQRVLDGFGSTRERVLGGKWTQWVHPDDLPNVVNVWNQSLATGINYEVEFRLFQKPSGTYHWHMGRALALRDRQGKIVNWFGTNTDIHDRVTAEIALRESEEYFRLLVEGVKDYAIYMLDPEGRVMSWNSGAECMTGYQAAEIIGRDFACFFPPEDIANAMPKQQLEAASVNSRCESESIFVRKDGSYFWANCILTALHDDTGELRGFCKLTRDITERKLTEKSLLRLQKAIESTSDGISIANISGQVIYVNPAFTEVLDYTGIQLNTCGGLVTTFRNPKVFETVLATVHRGESWHGEVTMQAQSGDYVQVDLRTDAIKDTTGKIVYLVSIYTDITQRRFIEEGLRLRDRAIAASSNGIIIADITIPDGSITYVNPAFERMTGYTAAEVMRQNFRLFLGADINQPALEQMKIAMQTGQDCKVILRNYRKDGSLFWHELNISPVYDTEACLTHYIGIQTDITQRKQAETALLVTQQRLQYLLSASPAVIYTSEAMRDYGTVFISNNIKGMVGYEAQEFVKDSGFWFSHIHPEDASDVLAELSQVQVFDKKQYSLEYRFLHADGTYRWIYDQGKVVWDKAGNPLELVGYWADITSRKQLEQELRTALEKEKELNELKSRFISMTSHEFRTPLSTILSSAELLEHYHQRWTEEKLLIHLRRIQTAVHRMTEMLDDILVIGKAEAGKLEYKPLFFDLVEYCRQLVEEVRLNLKSQHLIFFTSQCKSISCYMDDKLLGYILSNLLSNALKYSPDGSLVRFTLACKNEQAVLKIQDQGIGIPEENQPRLFESFYRANNVGNILGTGLGLAIVKKCVDIHNGEIYFTSQLGIGTQFTVKLPVEKYIK
ncbi:PAS domain S-box protein [Trichormus azollae]|jgi:PAS domain S-box-containing protein|uniref:histidine kinase n=1 Tax=Nostoc azollae (strain 0708) TaxID=551115 RepID=D7E087_NOSA0|nr:PAS domain S-box protein [Trichormus azollae]ADI62996.1 multi-sensor signal transduction histidine kinase ['Nostoc azollae' 0708]